MEEAGGKLAAARSLEGHLSTALPLFCQILQWLIIVYQAAAEG